MFAYLTVAVIVWLVFVFVVIRFEIGDPGYDDSGAVIGMGALYGLGWIMTLPLTALALLALGVTKLARK